MGGVVMEATGARKALRLTVNGREWEVEVGANETLLDTLREKLRLTGTKKGCDAGECGACTVLVGGQPMLSCLLLAVECGGRDILTIEGMADPKTGELHPIQKAFVEHNGVQCGFCTPGMILSARALLNTNSSPTEREIREAIDGNICRCTGYAGIVESISAAAEQMRKQGRP